MIFRHITALFNGRVSLRSAARKRLGLLPRLCLSFLYLTLMGIYRVPQIIRGNKKV